MAPANNEIFTMFEAEAGAVGEDLVRKSRILLNKAKLERMMGWMRSVKPHGERLLLQYYEFSKLDGKPEKGERKIADDFILLFDEVLAEASEREN